MIDKNGRIKQVNFIAVVFEAQITAPNNAWFTAGEGFHSRSIGFLPDKQQECHVCVHPFPAIPAVAISYWQLQVACQQARPIGSLGTNMVLCPKRLVASQKPLRSW